MDNETSAPDRLVARSSLLFIWRLGGRSTLLRCSPGPQRNGKETLYSTTEQGKQLCDRYHAVRHKFLIEALSLFGGEELDNGRDHRLSARALGNVRAGGPQRDDRCIGACLMMHRKNMLDHQTPAPVAHSAAASVAYCARLWSSTRDAAPLSPASADRNGSDAFGHATHDGTACAWEWQSISPSDAGFVPDIEARLDRLLADKRAWGLHGVIVARADRLVLERYFEGEDNARGWPLGKVAFDRDTLHDLRAVSKSIVGLLYGIALQQGKVPPPEAPLLASFPEYSDRSPLDDPPRPDDALGTDWDEISTPCANPANSETAMDTGSLPVRAGQADSQGARHSLDVQRRRHSAAGKDHRQRCSQTASAAARLPRPSACTTRRFPDCRSSCQLRAFQHCSSASRACVAVRLQLSGA